MTDTQDKINKLGNELSENFDKINTLLDSVEFDLTDGDITELSNNLVRMTELNKQIDKTIKNIKKTAE